MTAYEVRCGHISDVHRARMAEVIDGAFEENLQPILPDRSSRLRVLAAGTELRAVIGAFLGDTLIGVIGFRTAATGVFDAMTFGVLRGELGAGAIKAKAALKVLERQIEPGTMRIEFLAVEESARGMGVGSALLGTVEERACVEQVRLLELHVEQANIDAHRLYERAGFCDDPGKRDSAPRRWLQNQTDIRMTKEPRCTTS